jgi:hypothetical protein
MNSINYLEMLPLSGIAKYSRGKPSDGFPFTGYPRAHPSDKNRLILVNDPLGIEPVVLEFKLEDVLFVEEVPSAVTEAGEGIPMIKLWIQKGAIGMILEPFEVNESEEGHVSKIEKVRAKKERIVLNQPYAAPC